MTRMLPFFAIGLAAAQVPLWGTALSAAPAPRDESCDRACLESVAGRYIDALLRHDRRSVPFAGTVRATFNARPPGGDSEYFWRTISGVPFRQFAADPSAGQIAMVGVAEEGGARGAYFLRLKVAARQIVEVEEIVGPRTAGGVPDMISPNLYFDQILPADARSGRAALIAIADGYFEGLQKHDGRDVRSAPGCRRFENGVQTSLNPMGNAGPCDRMDAYTYMDRTKERRYPIVDVERGLVAGAMVIEVSKPKKPVQNASGTTAATPLSLFAQPHDTLIQEIFKISDGRIVEISAIRLDMPYMWGGGW